MAAKPQKKMMEKPVEEGTKNRKVDPPKLGGGGGPNSAPPKNRSSSDATSCISSSGDATSTVKESDMDQESMMAEQGYYYPASSYYGYSYPGYDGSVGEWDDQGYVISGEGMEMQYPVMQAENGSLMYYMPGFQPGYLPYSPYSPGTFGIDGQYIGQQPYLLSPMSPQPVSSPGYFPTPLPYGSEVVPSYMWDPSLLVGDGAYFDTYGGVSPSSATKSNFSTPSHTLAPPKSMPASKSSSNPGIKGTLPALDVSSGPGILNELKQVNKVAKNGSDFQAASVLAKGYFPMAKFPCSPQGKSGYLYPNSAANFKANARGWGAPEKFKTRGKSISDFDLLNEQNRGPRTNNSKGVLPSEADPAGSLVSEANDSSTVVIRRDQYNLADFSTTYDHALFFVIKSYSEDDIHKSIKYNVWASTPNGNKRLDSAYQDAQELSCQKDTKCPVFLFFSVNASGQFCGVAEMLGRVDFDKNMDFWQQDKWNGFFPVKWHIIKDVPNPHFRHIILENNDNKPVTNSRDTQEVKFAQGSEMLNIFKNYSSKTSILDDFTFYESRQKAMLEKRTRPATPRVGHLQKPDEITQVATALQSIDLSASAAKDEGSSEDKAKE